MLAEKNTCTGCGACAASCPINCIEMCADEEGFFYPITDNTRCISCQKCEIACPLLNKAIPQVMPQGYAAQNRNENVRTNSSSGGAFYALASLTFANSGVVCGAAYTKDFCVEHQIINSLADIGKLQGAKYSQSRAEFLFPEIERLLIEERWVLFVGTPCQVAGLKSYLKKDYDKLILIDMICHGAPSPLVWQKYLIYRRNKDAKGSTIISVNQRDKSSGWSKYRYSFKIEYETSKPYYTSQSEDVYMQGFVNNLYLRPSCAQCQFKGNSRHSDITIGDYWGVWDQHPEFDDDRGTSLVLVNTAKGAAYWSVVKADMDVLPVEVQQALNQNPSAYRSSEPHPKRKEFFERLEKDDFEQLISELLFGMDTRRGSIWSFICNLLKK